MPRPRRFLFLFLAALVVGLAVAWLLWPRTRLAPERFERIQVGMTLDEVEGIMGRKADIQQAGNNITRAPAKAGEMTHVWADPWDGLIAVACEDDRVVNKGFQPAEELPLLQRAAIWFTLR